MLGFLYLFVCLRVTLPIVDLWQYYVCRMRSAVTLCTLFFYVLNMPYVSSSYRTHGALVAHRHIYAPPRCTAGLYFALCIYLERSGVGLAGFKIRVNVIFIDECGSPIFCYNLLFFLSTGWFNGAGLFRLMWRVSLSQPCATVLV